MREYAPGNLEVLIPDGGHIIGPVREGLEKKGFKPVRQRQNGHLVIEIAEPPVIFIAQPSRQIPRLVAEGIYPLAIVGEDRLEEYRVSVSLANNPPPNIEKLGRLEVFDPRLRLNVLVRDNPVDIVRYAQLEDLAGQRVVTTYPAQTRQLFGGIPIQLDGEVDGKEEVQVWSHKAEACVVIIDRGTTMGDWKLRELGDPLMKGIQPVLIGNLQGLEERGEALVQQYEQFMITFRGSERLDGNVNLSNMTVLGILSPEVLENQMPAAS